MSCILLLKNLNTRQNNINYKIELVKNSATKKKVKNLDIRGYFTYICAHFKNTETTR